MKAASLRADILLVLTAMIWGFSFVAQRVGMEYVGPFTFNAVRFGLGSLSLLPLLIFFEKKASAKGHPAPGIKKINLLSGGLIAGSVLFSGASLQQAGIVYTTAGKAGFITGLYVLFVPLFGLIWKQYPSPGTWGGAVLAAVGLYLLSVTDSFTLSSGDTLVLLSAFFWSAHVLVIGWLAPRINVLKLATLQFAICSLLSAVVALAVENVSLDGIMDAALPILYGGIGSVGIAYTLQVIAQKDAKPAHSAIILSLEGVFAAVGGWLFLGEILSFRALYFCMLMFTGMLLSELFGLFREKKC